MKQSLLIFVNGYTLGCKALEPYWTEKGPQFLDAAAAYFGSSPAFHFVNGEGRWYSTAAVRFHKGLTYAAEQAETWKRYDSFCFVSHSMGAAFAEGMALYFTQKGLKITEIVHFSAADAESIRIPAETAFLLRSQLEMQGDRTLERKNRFKWKPARRIKGVNFYGMLQTDVHRMHPQVSPRDREKWDFHYDTKTFAIVWDYLETLKSPEITQNSDGTFTFGESGLVFVELCRE